MPLFLLQKTLIPISFAFACLLWLIRWKKKVFLENTQYTQVSTPYFKSLYSCSLALWSFLANEQSQPIPLNSSEKKLLKVLQEGNVIFVSAHFGKYEQMASWMLQQNIPLISSYLPLKNKLCNTFLEKLRNRSGHTNSQQNSLKDFQKVLFNKQTLGIMIDQASFKGSQGTFLGKECTNNRLPEILSKKYDCPIILGLWKSGKTTSFSLHLIQKEIPLQDINNILSLEAKTNPHLWYGWFHKRFKFTSNLDIYKKQH